MRREGRQRGMVRTFPVLSGSYDPQPGSRRTLNEVCARPTAGIFTKAPSKPTNHSKFTGKGPVDPACKSKAKAKVRSPSSNLGLDALQVAVKLSRVQVSGSSAKGVLDYLDSNNDEDCDYYYY